MKVLCAVLAIYGIGAMFVAVGAMYGLISVIAEKGLPRNRVSKIPLAILVLFWLTFSWPWVLYSDSSFRDCAIDMGRIFIIIGFPMAAVISLGYPWIWAWYVGGVISWLLLQRYHNKQTLVQAEKGESR